MALSRKLLSEVSTVLREDSVIPPESKPTSSSGKMMRIQSLLNPTNSSSAQASRVVDYANPSLTPVDSTLYSSRSTPISATPNISSPASSHKPTKGKAVTASSSPPVSVRFPPHEMIQNSMVLTKQENEEVYRQYEAFKIDPTGRDERHMISHTTKYIPYSSDKKDFMGSTGKNGFNVFKYTFQVPTDAKTYEVLWDFHDGLVRITPFFKACKYSKTTPNKALTATPGLKDLAHSVTGGSLSAQGYWLNHQCARAVCLTFCYKIRWVLVPVFGPSFLHECLPPDHPDFGRFKINHEFVRRAELDSRSAKTTPSGTNHPTGIPRSVPQDIDASVHKELRPRIARPNFMEGSPFESDPDISDGTGRYKDVKRAIGSPEVSPRTSLRDVSEPPGWTSINRQMMPPPLPLHNSLASSSLTDSLLTQPRYASWRPAHASDVHYGMPRAVEMPVGAHDKRRAHKRPRSSMHGPTDYGKSYADDNAKSDADVSESESNDIDIVVSPPRVKKQKRVRYHVEKGDSAATSATMSPATGLKKNTGTKSKKFTAEDARAAHLLLNLSKRDAELTIKPQFKKPMGAI